MKLVEPSPMRQEKFRHAIRRYSFAESVGFLAVGILSVTLEVAHQLQRSVDKIRLLISQRIDGI